MRKSRFSEEQIAYALRQVESGAPATALCRKLGISEETFYRWKRKYAGMGVAEFRRVKQLEEENGRLKRLVARCDGGPEEVARGGDCHAADDGALDDASSGVPLHFGVVCHPVACSRVRASNEQRPCQSGACETSLDARASRRGVHDFDTALSDSDTARSCADRCRTRRARGAGQPDHWPARCIEEVRCANARRLEVAGKRRLTT
jgi:putative transposase